MVLETEREQQHVTPTNAATSLTPARAPIAALSAPVSSGVDDLLEFAIGWADQTFGAETLVAAREDFHLKTGKAFHEDLFYEARTSYFFEYFLFQRPLGADGPTPFQDLLHRLDDGRVTLSDDAASTLRALGEFRHSLFMIKKVETKSMVVLDLIGSKKYRVLSKGDEIYAGFEKGNVLQAFLFPRGEAFHLGLGLVLHPAAASRGVAKHLKLAQKDKTMDVLSLLFKLASLQIRHIRHRHVDPKKIYQPTGK